jgi:Na+:H+ antiporter, NhaA family
MQISKLFRDFVKSESAGGLILLGCTILSLILVNSPIGHAYEHFWHLKIGNLSISHWINDLLMAIFFLLVGLEIEREIYVGELKSPGKALFPVVAAIGGMLIPAGIYIFINLNADNQSGFGIPMATDIAFALGMLTLLGSRIPTSLKIFLTALAIIDDLGAIIVIAIFYTGDLQWNYLLFAGLVYAVLLVLNRLNVKTIAPYLILGLVMWYFMLQSGVHATLTGVLLAFAIPFRDGSKTSPSYKMQHLLHNPVAFFILPVFALANTAIFISGETFQQVWNTHGLGIIGGLVLGKPFGILLFTFAAVKFGLAELPEGVNWKLVTGAALMAGIGFTMSIFISMLAYTDAETIAVSKLAVLIASAIAATIGITWLIMVTKKGVGETDVIVSEEA